MTPGPSEPAAPLGLRATRSRAAQLVACLGRVRADLEFEREGGTLLYAVDFSEIHAFLHPDRDGSETVALGLGPTEPADELVLMRLGLSHLFRTFGERLHLLPGHALELSHYLHTVEAQARRAEGLAAAVRDWIESLSARERASLDRLSHPGALSDDEQDAIVDLMRDEASRLCEQVAELTGWMTADTAIGELRTLVREQRLSYRLDAALQQHGVPPLHKPDLDDERVAFRGFPERIRTRRRAQKMRDARALIHLRDANRALAPKGARLLLVTRDTGMLDAAEALALDRDFAWPEVGLHLRTLDEVLLDLLQRGALSPSQRAEWLAETETLFSEVLQSLDGLLRYQPTGAKGTGRFRKLAKRRVATIQRLWRDHKQLRLSMAMPRLDWLSTDFILPFGQEPDEVDDPTIPPGDDGAVPQLRQLVRFVSTDAYQAQAREDLRALRLELAAQTLQVLFLGRLGEQRLDKLVRFFGEGWAGHDRDDSTLLRSTRYTLVCSVEFVTHQYRDLLAALAGWEQDEEARYTRLEEVFFRLVQQAVGQDHDAEGFLFMAFVLAMLGQWEDAREVALTGLDLDGRYLRHEANYLLAVITRRLGSTRPSEALDRLVEAYNHVMEAIDEKRRRYGLQDPRYLLEQGTIVLQWRHIAASLGGVAANRKRGSGAAYHPGFIGRPEAVRMLREALQLVGDDPRLEVDLRNNLAYAAATAPEPDLAEARAQVHRIEQLFAEVAPLPDPPMPPQPWPVVRDTMVLIDALEARARGDRAGVLASLATWEALHDDPNLLAVDRASIARGIAAVRAWPLVRGGEE